MKMLGGLGGMMRQMKQMQEEMEKEVARIEQELTGKRLEATAGGGLVRVAVNGMGKVLEVSIDRQQFEAERLDLLEDALVVAIHEAMEQAKAEHTRQMKELTGNLGISELMDAMRHEFR
jgi:DNA-binding YbaB/EbfC family protein